eukprot:TRINITY_DN445_c0_g1_i1.p1 TRINITY_DN445_c0_g1~~TRINITY_DN445_c0_g1_i1.p1  ORF type:complete len:1081 (-),score=350.18 TRINITY_DN445_c0_g1_i1:1623-4865(-)
MNHRALAPIPSSLFQSALDVIDHPVIVFEAECKPVFLNRSFRHRFSDVGAFRTAYTFPGLEPSQLSEFFDCIRSCNQQKRSVCRTFDFTEISRAGEVAAQFRLRPVEFLAAEGEHVVCMIKDNESRSELFSWMSKQVKLAVAQPPSFNTPSFISEALRDSADAPWNDALAEACAAAFETRLEVSIERSLPLPNGDSRSIRATAAALGSSDDVRAPVAVLTEDITEIERLRLQLADTARKLAESEAEAQRQRERNDELVKAHLAALQVKSRFLATISHEMKTPLAGVLTSLSLIKYKHLPPDVADAVSIAQVCGSQLEVIIGDMLDLAKMEESKVELECIPFRPYNTVDEALEIVCFHAEKNQIELMCDIQSPFPDIIKGDGCRLRQILVNLLSNACKFSRPEGEVLLTATGRDLPDSDAYELSFAVQDWGVGIAEESKRHLFQPFVQADSSITRKFGGTGLGLSICKRLVECMGGTIGFESELGRGSTFHFNVQVTKLSTVEAFRKPFLVDNSISRRSFSCLWDSNDAPLRVLLVDKNVNFLRSLQKRVLSWGWSAEIAHTADQAYNVLRTRFSRDQTQKFDAVIIDTKQGLIEPKIFERCRMLSGDALVVQMGFIRVVTAPDVERVPFIKKPLRPARLRSAVCEWSRSHCNRQSIKSLFFQRRIRRNSVDDLAMQEAAPVPESRRGATLDARQRRSLSFSPSEETGDIDVIAHPMDEQAPRPGRPLNQSGSGSSRLFLPSASALFGAANASQFLSPSSSVGSAPGVLTGSGSSHGSHAARSSPPRDQTVWAIPETVVPFARSLSMSRSPSSNDIAIAPPPLDDCPPEGLRIALGRRGSVDSRTGDLTPSSGRHIRRTPSVVSILTSPRSRPGSANSSPTLSHRGDPTPTLTPSDTPPVLRRRTPTPSPTSSPRHRRSKSFSNDGNFEMRILVAEDNAVNRHLLGRLLSSIGKFNVTMVENGRQAVEVMQAQTFDLVLMDVCMPELDGWEATELIRRQHLESQPPIIAVTANSFEEDRQRCYSVGMDSIIMKPIKKESLISVIRQYDPRLNNGGQPTLTVSPSMPEVMSVPDEPSLQHSM